MIAHAGKPPCGVSVLHFGQVTWAIAISLDESSEPGGDESGRECSIVEAGHTMRGWTGRKRDEELRDDECDNDRTRWVCCDGRAQVAAKERVDARRDAAAGTRNPEQCLGRTERHGDSDALAEFRQGEAASLPR